MGATKIMFHKRFMCDPLKYSNHRIAFLDQDLIRKMEKDYKHFSSDSKTYKWTDYYANHQNGTAHSYTATNKKWLINMDTFDLVFLSIKSIGWF